MRPNAGASLEHGYNELGQGQVSRAGRNIRTLVGTAPTHDEIGMPKEKNDGALRSVIALAEGGWWTQLRRYVNGTAGDPWCRAREPWMHGKGEEGGDCPKVQEILHMDMDSNQGNEVPFYDEDLVNELVSMWEEPQLDGGGTSARRSMDRRSCRLRDQPVRAVRRMRRAEQVDQQVAEGHRSSQNKGTASLSVNPRGRR